MMSVLITPERGYEACTCALHIANRIEPLPSLMRVTGTGPMSGLPRAIIRSNTLTAADELFSRLNDSRVAAAIQDRERQSENMVALFPDLPTFGP